LQILREEGYKPVDILISRDGIWHVNGLEMEPHEVVQHVDLVWNAMHGSYGEDGQVQHVLESIGIPFVGSNSFSSYLTFAKSKTKDRLKKLGIKTPQSLLLKGVGNVDTPEKMARRIIRELHGGPWVVKPNASGSSVLTFKVSTHQELLDVLQKMIDNGVEEVLVEEFISGKEGTVGVIHGFRYQDVYTLPPVEIRKHPDAIWGHEEKYDGSIEEVCPGNFTPEERHELEELAALLHKEFDLSHYSRTDFMICPKRGIHVLEINTLPGLTEASLFPKALDAVGSSMSEFVDHIIGDVLAKHLKIRK
jgi:D-alanine-D-alanine ligase